MKYNRARTWLAVSAAARGRGHIRRNVVCQDKTMVSYSHGTIVIALADGAGSAEHSALGARSVVNTLGQVLAANFADYYDNSDAKQVASNILSAVKSELGQVAQNHSVDLNSLASTLLAVAIKDDRYIFVQLGDGITGALKNGQIISLAPPVNGEFANTTVFTITEKAECYIQLGKGLTTDIDGFVLISDGAASSLFQKRQQRFAGAVATLFTLGKVLPKQEMTRVLSEYLLPAVVAKTTDDCSVAMLIRQADQLSVAKINHLSKIWPGLLNGMSPNAALSRAGVRKKYQRRYLNLLKKYAWI